MKRRSASLLLALVALASCREEPPPVRPPSLSAAASEAPSAVAHDGGAVELSLVSYNLHGLPSWIAFDDPPSRMTAIGPLLSRYDVALLQEDWSHHDALMASVGAAAVRRGNGPRGTAFGWLTPFCGHCGSGLTLLSIAPKLKIELHEASPLPGCAGWLSGGNDCFATKGFLRARLALATGIEVDLVDLHLDAGPGADDQEVRRTQLDALADRLERSSAGRALVVAGDFNLDLDDPPSRTILDAFRDRLALLDSGAHPRHERGAGGAWVRIDHVFFRRGDDVRVEPIAAGEATEFVRDGAPLSDHPAVSVRFRLARDRGGSVVR